MNPRSLLVALLAACALMAAPAAAQAAETIEFQDSYSYATNNMSHSVTVNVTGGAALGTAHVLWSLAQNGGGTAPQTPIDISLDGSGAGSGNLTYTPSYPAPASSTDVISGVCIDDNPANGSCDGGEPVPTVYTSHSIYVGEPYVYISGNTSLNTGDSASLSVHAQAYGIGTDLTGVTVQWTHSGANTSASGSFSTNGTGDGTITTWAGTNPGQDDVRVWIDDAGGTTGTYDSGEGTGTAAVVFTEGTITLGSLNNYYLTGTTPNLTATVYSDGNNGATTPVTLAGQGVAVKYQVAGGAVQTASTDLNSQITIPLSSPDTSTNPYYVSVYVWRDVVTANDSIDSGEPNTYTSTNFNVPNVSYPSISPSSTLGVGRNVTLSYVTQDYDYTALASQSVCWLVTSGPNVGTHGVTAASDGGGNGTYTYTSSSTGTDNLSLWLQSRAACGASPPPSTVEVTQTSVTWVMAISSGGPLTDVYADASLNCQARYGGDTAGEFYGSTYGASSSCHPFLVVDGSYTSNFTPVSQTGPTPISGGGYEIDTTACANVAGSCGGATAPLVTQVVTYFPGSNYYRTDYTVQFRDGASHTVRLYQYADCYLQNSDAGYGFASDIGLGGNGGIYCSQYPGNSPQGRIEGFVPLDPGGSYYEAHYSTAYSAITSAAATGHMFDNSGDVTNTCQCGTYQDNGMAIGWQGSVGPNGTLQHSLLTDFSPSGVSADLYGPNVTLDVPVDGGVTTDTQPTFSGQAGTLPTDLPAVTVDVYSGSSASGSPVASYSTSASGGSWSVQAGGPLPLGTYTAQASQSDQSGNVGLSTPHTFVITSPPPPAPTGTASQEAPQRFVPPPVFGQTINVTPLTGAVFVTEPGGKRVPLTSSDQIQLGSVIDATKGRVRLTIQDKTGKLETADFYQGVFKITQLPKKKGGILKLTLVGGKFKLCPTARGAKAASGKKLKKTASVQHLWGQGTGAFRTQGRFSAATVRGTTWLTDDRCDGTLTRVTTGLVAVHDDVRNKTIVLKTGQRYLATAG